jgi:gliding motility-associated protein GldE
MSTPFNGLLFLSQLITESSDWWLSTTLIVTIVIGLIFSALFSASEVALFALANKIKSANLDSSFGQLVSDGIIKKMLEKPRRLLATILIGNTFANVILSVAAAVLTANFASSFDIPSYMVLIFQVLAVTFVILILSEITPKTMAIKSPLGVSRFISRPIYFFFIILRPIAAIMAKSAFLLERTLPRPAHKLKSTDIRTMAKMGSEQGSINDDEQELIENVIEFGNTTVKEIMTSRMNIKAVGSNESLSNVIVMIQDAGFSRMPLYQDDIDHIIGIVFAKDILPYLFTDTNNTVLNWKTLAKPVHFIPPTKKLDDLLRDFQRKKTHMAVVVDEYGGTEGIITLDDLLEEIIGDFEDEHSDEDDKLYTLQKNGTYLFDPSIDLDDMETVLKVDLTTDKDEYETLGGLVYHLMERLPTMGEMIIFNDLELYIQTVEKNRIKKVRVRKLLTKSEG